MQLIKVLFFIDSYRIGGMHKQILYLSKYMNKDEFMPIVCTSSNKGGLKNEFENTNCKLIDLGWSRSFDLKVLIRLIKILYSEKPQIIFITEAQNLVYFRVARIFYFRSIFQIGSFRAYSFYINHKNKKYQLVDNIFSRLLHFTSKIITTNSQALKDYYSKILTLSPYNDRIKVIYNGSELNTPITKSPQYIRTSLNIADNEILLLMLARLDPWKDFHTLFTSVIELKKRKLQFKLVLVGDGELELFLKNLVLELNINEHVIFVGEVNDPINYINAADISILSTNGEGFSNTILETMALGKPIIATAVGGNSEAIGTDSTCGYLVPPKNSKDLTDRIFTLMKDPDKRNELGKNAKDRISRMCNMEKYITSYEKLFKSLF